MLSAPSWGCAHGPRSFKSVESPAPFVRARAVGLARRQPDSSTLPVLIERLGDTDPVVRLAAHEELRRRTGQDFGYVPWAGPEERASAISRWRGWAGQGRGSLEERMPVPAAPTKVLPTASGQTPAPGQVH